MNKNSQFEPKFVNEVSRHIDRAVRARFGKDVELVETDWEESALGEVRLTITIHISVSAKKSDLLPKFSGLTRALQRVMGERLDDVFPEILPVSAAPKQSKIMHA